MNDLMKQAKKRAKQLMAAGDISGYIRELTRIQKLRVQQVKVNGRSE